MVHRRVRKSRGAKLLANHNRCWIWGRNAVAETLRAGRWPILELALSRKLAGDVAEEFSERARDAGISVTSADDEGLTKLCRAADHQGCAARMAEFPYLAADEFLARMSAESIVVILDRIQDPYNFGAIVRTAEGLGLDGLLIGTSEQAGVNSLVARSSAGAVNHLPIGRVDELTDFVQALRANRWQVWGASEKGSVALSHAKPQLPLALIIGNEGTGIAPELLALCTQTAQIPMRGRVGSLNAAVSAGILCYEAAEARRRLASGT